MLNYDVLSKKPSVLRYFSGLELQEFEALNLKIKERYTTFEQKRLFRADRKRKIGAGHPFKLSLTDRLLMLLVYYHLYVSSTLASYLFDLSQTNVLKDIRKIEPLVSEVLPLPKKMHQKVRRLRTLDEVETVFPGFKAFLDATEQEIPRPKAKRKRKTHYSGKKKKHTVKTQITVNKDGLIVHKTRHARGSTHDYALFKHNHPHLHDVVSLGVDLGYVGIKTDYPELGCEVPFKRRSPGRGKRGVKAKELTPDQKSFNKRLSKERAVVEHTFSRVKKFRIWAEEFRNRLKHYDVMTDIVCGLVNFRITGTTTI
ncbi:transposase [Candidatus Bathyarchaeota archaeon]|nr:transposase [Candidatus Bathyarchaeota archaeon]